MHTNSTRKPRPDWPTTHVLARPTKQAIVYAGGHWIAVKTHDIIVMAALRHAIRVDAYRCKIVERPALDHINNRPC